MKVCILGAGLGTRLRPLTNEVPKCMVPLLGKPLLERQLECIKSSGIDDVIVVGGYCADVIQELNVKTILNKRYNDTNMVFSLMCARKELSGSDVIISYGDIVYEKYVLDSLLNIEGDLVVTVDRKWHDLWSARMSNPLEDAETMVIDNNKIIEIGNKTNDISRIQGQYIGLIKMSSSTFQKACKLWDMIISKKIAVKDVDNLYMTDFIQILIDNGNDATPAYIDSGWLEVDSVSDLEAYEALQKDNKLKTFFKLDE